MDQAGRARTLLRWTGAGAVVFCIALVVLELVVPGLRRWWVERPLLLGVAAGLLTLLIGALIVERLITNAEQRLQEEHYRRLQAVGLRALGASVTQVIDGMNWLLLGKAPSTYVTGIFGDAPTLLPEILARNRLGLHEHDDLGALDGEELQRRARILAACSDWQRLAIDVLDILKWRHRGELAQWATLMMASQELSVVLDRLAYFNEAIGHAQAPLRALHHGSGDVQRAEGHWFAALSEAISLREDLYVAAGDPPSVWSRFRTELPELTSARLAEHDQIDDPRKRLRSRLRHPELAGSDRPALVTSR